MTGDIWRKFDIDPDFEDGVALIEAAVEDAIEDLIPERELCDAQFLMAFCNLSAKRFTRRGGARFVPMWWLALANISAEANGQTLAFPTDEIDEERKP